MAIGKISVAPNGPPSVSTQSMSNVTTAQIVVINDVVRNVLRIIGKVTLKKVLTGPAPSTSAASYISLGIVCSAASIVISAKGAPFQTLMPVAVSRAVLTVRKLIGAAIRPMLSKKWFASP